MSPITNLKNQKILASIERASAKLSIGLGEALTRLDEATSRVVALGDLHIKLATVLMNAMGITLIGASVMPPLRGQVETISLSMKAEVLASGFLRPVTRSLGRPAGEIAEAIKVSEERILKITEEFDMTEMDVLASELSRTPERVLGPDEQTAFRNKVMEWVQKLKDIISGSSTRTNTSERNRDLR